MKVQTEFLVDLHIERPWISTKQFPVVRHAGKQLWSILKCELLFSLCGLLHDIGDLKLDHDSSQFVSVKP